MKVHHGFYVNDVGVNAVNDGVPGVTTEIRLAVLTQKYPAAFGFSNDAQQGALKLSHDDIAEPGMETSPLNHGGFQILLGFRMVDDAHGVFCGFH